MDAQISNLHRESVERQYQLHNSFYFFWNGRASCLYCLTEGWPASQPLESG